mgnify:CR=1 FL=1
MLSAGVIAWVGVVFLAAGFVKGVVGMGLPTVAMGLLAVTMPPVEAAALLLKKPETSITDVALACGIQSSQYFAPVFRARHGRSSRVWRQLSTAAG